MRYFYALLIVTGTQYRIDLFLLSYRHKINKFVFIWVMEQKEITAFIKMDFAKCFSLIYENSIWLFNLSYQRVSKWEIIDKCILAQFSLSVSSFRQIIDWNGGMISIVYLRTDNIPATVKKFSHSLREKW